MLLVYIYYAFERNKLYSEFRGNAEAIEKFYKSLKVLLNMVWCKIFLKIDVRFMFWIGKYTYSLSMRKYLYVTILLLLFLNKIIQIMPAFMLGFSKLLAWI